MKKTFVFLLGVWFLSSCSSSSDQSTESAISESVADSLYRPSYHFSPTRNWMGAPVSMVLHNEEYHLFYQYNADGITAKTNSWGHASSSDMMLWNKLSALSIFDDYQQGSIVSDAMNSSSLGENLLIALVNENDEVNLLYSKDGFSWTEYNENPVLESVGTPKVSWYKETNQWIMTLTNQMEITFYSSDDLIHWSQESNISLEKIASSAELFPVSDLWGLLLNSERGVDILLGKFDGSTFSIVQKAQSFDLGTDNSAGTIAKMKDRSVYIGWMNNPTYMSSLPTKSWKSSLTLPRELRMNDERQLTSFPVSEIKSSLTAKRRGKLDLLKSRSANWYSFSAISQSENVKISILNERGEKLALDYDQNSFILDRSASGFKDFHKDFSKVVSNSYPNLGDTIKFDIFIDRSSIEIFINDGLLQFTSLVFPQNPYNLVELVVGDEKRNIPATIYDIDMYED